MLVQQPLLFVEITITTHLIMEINDFDLHDILVIIIQGGLDSDPGTRKELIDMFKCGISNKNTQILIYLNYISNISSFCVELK